MSTHCSAGHSNLIIIFINDHMTKRDHVPRPPFFIADSRTEQRRHGKNMQIRGAVKK